VSRDPRAGNDPCLLVIFGASGDLTRRKLLPALYNLAQDGLLPERFAVLGVARPAMTDEEFRATMRQSVEEAEGEAIDAGVWSRLDGALHYMSGEFDNAALFAEIGRRLEALGRQHQAGGNVLFYLAVPPTVFGPIVVQLHEAGLTRGEHGWRRVIV
jgi:glucose-6-phosphate 1-dehydrogenase